MGVDGVKIDFCEEFPDEEYLYGGNMTIEYDWYDPSVIPTGGEHHSYPSFFMSSFYQRMNELKLEYGYTDGFYVLSRGGGIGSQRNPYIWAGDQCREFSRLEFHLMGTVSSGLSGVPFVTYDMAGYRYDRKNHPYEDTEENRAYESAVFARAIEYTAFTFIIQTHGTVRNAYEMTEEVQQIYRIYCDLHTRLTDYISKYVEIACATGIPVVRHPVLEYQQDTNVYGINDQFLLGKGLMVAPILTEDTYEREVYLPEGSWTSLLTGEVLEGGRSYTVSANLGQVPLFINNGTEDAEELHEVFSCDTWKMVMEWESP
jgi:alpha-glucosidase (family GH31 glycosyl hydrolase)